MRHLLPVLLLAFASAPLIAAPTRGDTAAAPAPQAVPAATGVVQIQSHRSVDETAAAIRNAVEAKGIRFFTAIDQGELGAQAGVPIARSTLVLFGNPPLGVQFLKANPYAGLDWPVRMLVSEDAQGRVWIAWTDFAFVAQRYHLNGLDPQLTMASQVAATIASEAAG